MRKKLNLDLKDLSKFMTLFHGQYSHGKTHVMGDMLRYYRKQGLSTYFINVQGEDGYLTLANFGLGESGETIETYKDADELINELIQKPVHALGIDSFKPLAQRLVYGKVCGEGKLPSGSEHWTQIHFAMETIANRLRRCANIVLAVCPSDKSVNQLDQKTYITPDLPGREAVGSAGWFDLVGLVQSDTISAKDVKRVIKIAPSITTVTRQRLPKTITEDIKIPEGEGGWKAFLDKLEETFK